MRIKELRQLAGMSQETLAKKLNVTQTAVSQWETERTSPDISLIIAMSNLFNVTTDYLLEKESYTNTHENNLVSERDEIDELIDQKIENGDSFFIDSNQFNLLLSVFPGDVSILHKYILSVIQKHQGETDIHESKKQRD